MFDKLAETVKYIQKTGEELPKLKIVVGKNFIELTFKIQVLDTSISQGLLKSGFAETPVRTIDTFVYKLQIEATQQELNTLVIQIMKELENRFDIELI